MIKYAVIVKPGYNYQIIQLDVNIVTQNGKQQYVVDRATYDAHAAANRGKNGFWGNKFWKLPSILRGRYNTIDPSIVFDTREDAAANAIALVEQKLREDVALKKSQIEKLEKEIVELSGKQLSPQGKFMNCSTVSLKKGKS